MNVAVGVSVDKVAKTIYQMSVPFLDGMKIRIERAQTWCQVSPLTASISVLSDRFDNSYARLSPFSSGHRSAHDAAVVRRPPLQEAHT